MNADPAPPLLLVEDPFALEAVELLACPHCWKVTSVWLGAPGRTRCGVCYETFDPVGGEA